MSIPQLTTPPPRRSFPPVRACLFDMDGLLLNTEDIYTVCINRILAKYERPSLPWSVKARLQGRPYREANALFMAWADLPLTADEFTAENSALQREEFPKAGPLPGVEDLLAALMRTRWWGVQDGGGGGGGGPDSDDDDGEKKGNHVHLCLATSSHSANFALKTAHLPGPVLTPYFSTPFPAPHARVLGDDARIPSGRGKPWPDIYRLALSVVNARLRAADPAATPVRPDECLVFEDSVPGIEAGRRAGMRVVWCPHPGLREEYRGREEEVLAGRTGEAVVEDGGGEEEGQDGGVVGELGDGWGEHRDTLEGFDFGRYGIVVPPKEVEDHPAYKKPTVEDAPEDE